MLFAPLDVGVSLVPPGVLDTGFYAAGTLEVHVDADDIAAAVRYVPQCPPDVDLSTVVVRPRRQLM